MKTVSAKQGKRYAKIEKMIFLNDLQLSPCMMTSSNRNIFRVAGPVTGEFPAQKIQWRAALTFSLSCAWINGWVNNRKAGDLIRHRSHYDVTVMRYVLTAMQKTAKPMPIFFAHAYMFGRGRCMVWHINDSTQACLGVAQGEHHVAKCPPGHFIMSIPVTLWYW